MNTLSKGSLSTGGLLAKKTLLSKVATAIMSAPSCSFMAMFEELLFFLFGFFLRPFITSPTCCLSPVGLRLLIMMYALCRYVMLDVQSIKG